MSVVLAAFLCGLAPLFCEDALPRWIHRADLFAPHVTIADDASADALYDGEGTGTRRIELVRAGAGNRDGCMSGYCLPGE